LNSFVKNSITCYNTGPNIAVDSQFPTKAQGVFSHFMGNELDRYGIKFWMAVDAYSKCIVNGFPNLGKEDDFQTTGQCQCGAEADGTLS
jgi:hypothetical protein